MTPATYMPSDEALFYTSDSAPYEKTYGNWTVEWWRWALSIPKTLNPVLDTTGDYAGINQKYDHMFFLAGALAVNTCENTSFSPNFPPKRFCSISSKKSILFPVINCEANQLEHPYLKTNEDLIEHVKRDEDTIVKKECFVDHKSILVQRVRSDPIIFELSMVEDNIFNVIGGASTYASSDGYWVFLKPLPKGEHLISFKGSCEYGKLNSGAFYHLSVC
jgi:hypothetical protein